MTRHWIAVASAEHVRRGLAGGFMQVCHGKGAPLRRIQPGDLVVYYSPTERFGERGSASTALRSFTAIGEVLPRAPYQVDMGGGFQPFRRDVRWCNDVREAKIAALLPDLAFCGGRKNWAFALRFGLLAIADEDYRLIAAAMHGAAATLARPADPPTGTNLRLFA